MGEVEGRRKRRRGETATGIMILTKWIVRLN